MNKRNVIASALVAVSAASWGAGVSLAHAQSRNDAAPFRIMEATIDDIQAAFKSGTLTARQLVQGYLERIVAYDKQGPTINSIITLNDRALDDADRLDAAYRASGPVGPLHGIPVLVKDEIDTAGMPTTLGTQVFKDYRPLRDAFAIEKLRKAGAIILGKATLSEYAGGDTYGSMFGVTRNPFVRSAATPSTAGTGASGSPDRSWRRPAPSQRGGGYTPLRRSPRASPLAPRWACRGAQHVAGIEGLAACATGIAPGASRMSVAN